MSNESSKSLQRAEANPNENCLVGMECPNCGRYGPFRIMATSTKLCDVFDDGTEFVGEDVEWYDSSMCQCPGCNHSATVGDFKRSAESEPDHDEDGDREDVTMGPLEVVLGKNVCAYGKFILPTGTAINPKAIKEACLAAEGDVLFSPDWVSSHELRIVSIESDDGAIDYTGYPLEPVPAEPEGVVKHLDLSTGHLTVETREWMSKADPSHSHCTGITVAAYEYGAFFSVPSEVDSIENLACPEDLKVLLKYARKLGCDVLRVDSAGLILDHLPYYEGF